MSFEQKLFWNNMPSKIVRRTKKNNNFSNLLRHSFLKHIHESFFLYTGTNNIDFSFINQDPKLMHKLKKRKVKFFLYEPVSYYFDNESFNLGYYSEFHSDYNNSINLRAEELDCINEFGRKINGIVVNHCDYGLEKLVGEKYPHITFRCRDIFIRQAAMSYMPLDPKIVPKVTKKFWCGNGRYTIHRHMVMCFLADKPGNYSWYFNSDTDWESTVDWIESLPKDYLKKNNKILNQEKFELDFSSRKMEVEEKHCLYLPDGAFSQPNITYKKTFDECFVCIVNETRFAQPTANFSEKIIDAINYKKPFIVVAPPKTLEYIRKFGIKTFSDYWDELYDEIENHNDRMLAIFALIDKINSKSLAELNELNRDMQIMLEHNRNVIKKLPRNNSVIK